MKKNFGMMFALFAIIGSALLVGGCTVVDEDPVDGDSDTTIVNPPDTDTDVTVTPPAGGSVDIDR